LAGAKFSRLETLVGTLQENVKSIRTTLDNMMNPAYGAASPINLNTTGDKWVVEAGLKDYIDKNKDTLMKDCQTDTKSNPYEIQQCAFKVFDNIVFESSFENTLQSFGLQTRDNDACVETRWWYLPSQCVAGKMWHES